MNRNFLTEYLSGLGCYPEEGTATEAGEWWINAVTSDVCLIPLEEELALTTYCHIFCELKIDPPVDHGYDSDYAVYSSWKEHALVFVPKNWEE